MEKLMDSFMNEHDSSFEQYLENYRMKKLKYREDYAGIQEEREKILDKFPNVRALFEDEVYKGYTSEESEAINDIFTLMVLRDKIELKEAFKLGFKEAYIFFEEQDMLDI